MKCIVCDNKDGGYCEFCAKPRRDYVSGGTALELELSEDSAGFEMAITNEDGTVYTFNVHLVAMALMNAGAEVRDYFREGERAAASYVPPVTEEDLNGYDRDDPKVITLRREMER